MPRLLSSPRFLPLFVTQFFGAFNDNLFKNALVILVTYRIAADDPAWSAQLVNLAFGLSTLPTLLFSYLAGQLADKYDRARIARLVKLSEIALAALGGIGLYTGNIPVLLATLFGFGTHSAFFGPVKYALLPQLLAEDELIAGNGYVEAGSFLAILGGTILGGLLILTGIGAPAVAFAMISFAVAGYMASRRILASPAPVPGMVLGLNPFRETFRLIRHSMARREEFLCILGISWFWFIGALFLAQFSPFARDVLHADEHIVTLFLVAFSVGIAIGSLLCARLIRGRVQAMPVPFGALGMTLCAIDLYLATRHMTLSGTEVLLTVTRFLASWQGIRVLADLLGLAICGGVFIVPLYALLQLRADKTHGARAIASNNVVNAVFMVASAGLAVALIACGFTIPQIFLTAAILNAFVAIYICRLLPFSLVAAVLKLLYRVEIRGLENWDKAGDRVLIVANHTAFLDAAIFAAFLPERVGFAVNSHVAGAWWLRRLLRLVDAYPVDPANPMAAKTLIDKLKQNKKIMIFPEGRLTMTGALMKIYEGPGLIADKSGAMVLPVRIDGAQYSPTSRLKGKVRIRLFPKVTLTFLPPHKLDLPSDLTGRRRRGLAGTRLYDLMSRMIFETSPVDNTLFQCLLDASRIHGVHHIIAEDQKRVPVSYRSFITRSLMLARLLDTAAPDDKTIALLLPNMTATAIAFFGIQAMGRTAAMLNFTMTPAQLAVACATAQLRVVVTARQFVTTAKLEPAIAALTAADIRILYLEDLTARLSLADKAYALTAACFPARLQASYCKARPHDPAVILFTSGSEGAAKGVVLSHRNILVNGYQLASRIDFGPQDIVFNCLPMFHAFGLTGGTLLPMLAGIKVFFYPSPLHYRIVPELVYDSNATILFGTDTFLAGYAKQANPYDFYALRYVFAGAERLQEETRRVWFEKFGIRIFEGYGATETAPVISVNTAMHYRAGTVGRFVPDLETRLDQVPGIAEGLKLLVKGPNVMLGYLKPDAPGRLQPLTDGWYDTGDIVSVDADGFVTIKGRTRRFAKIAGEMVSLSAVETAIAGFWPDHRHAVVSLPDSRKGEALVLVTENQQADGAGMRTALRNAGLPELAVPRRLLKQDKLPLLGTGKIDYVMAHELAMAQQQQLVDQAGNPEDDA